MEIFKNPNYNFLSWKWPLICLSLVLSISGQISLLMKGGPIYGIDFKGGAEVLVKFKDVPNLETLRKQLDAQGIKDATLQRYDDPAKNEIIISLEQKGQDEAALNHARTSIADALRNSFGQTDASKVDLNNAGRDQIADRLVETAGVSSEDARTAADAIVKARSAGGLINNIGDLRSVPGVTPAIANSFEKGFSLCPTTWAAFRSSDRKSATSCASKRCSPRSTRWAEC